MAFAPHSVVYLLNVPLTSENKNQLDFPNVAAQTNYFQSRVIYSFNDFTYQRKENVIRVPVEADNLYQCNYVMYQNANFTGKWFYAFITQIEYVNPSTTYIHIKTDVFQTWQFNITYYNSYVMREHVESDRAGEHTLSENVETGDVIAQTTDTLTGELKANTATEFDNNFIIVVAMSEHLDDSGGYAFFDGLFGGVPDFIYYYAVPRESMRTFQQHIDEHGQAAAVVAVYCVPKRYVNLHDTGISINGRTIYQIDDKFNQDIGNIWIYTGNGFTNFEGYSPKNRKLLCYPYNFLRLHNNNGSTVDLKIENFYNNEENEENNRYAKFAVFCTPTINGCIIAAPKNYGFDGFQPAFLDGCNFQYSVEYSNFPQVAYTSNAYLNYVALNANSISMQKANYAVQGTKAALQLAGGDVMGGVNSAVNTGLSVAGFAADMADMSEQPRQIKGTPTGNVEMKSGSSGIFVSSMSIKREYAQIIDEYFTRYGYKVNKLKVPQFNSRPNWNYIQTRNITIKVNAPQDDIKEIETMFNNGVTIWHNPETYGDYTQPNYPK